MSLFGNVYEGKTVFLTGHTGFKGSWLAFWLHSLGAHVIGFSLEPPTKPSLFETLGLSKKITHIIGDVRDLDALRTEMGRRQPEFVFHLAAQPLVRLSYEEPVETFNTNIMGTINVLEAVRKTSSVRSCLCITSDKCYENREWIWGYRENDPMGGYDPYSASKGCAELVTASYRNSFFNTKEYGKTHNTLVASARAGNVIGGGDWAADRLIPDIMKATDSGKKVILRNPLATRPWQHVLEPLSGYLMLGQKLLEGKNEFAQGWNFGPHLESNKAVESVVTQLKRSWDKIEFEVRQDPNSPHEAGLLHLDCSKANSILEWKPVWGFAKTLQITSQWYKEYYENNKVLCGDDLNEYIYEAEKNTIEWTR
ncbi:MAG: CDP-glucose 4,6-dehydratase [Candidatus Ozemobacteraceae bacterium]